MNMRIPRLQNDASRPPRQMLRNKAPRQLISHTIWCRFAEGSASPAERAMIVSHLLFGCLECSRALARQWRRIPAERTDYTDAFRQSAERALEAFAARAR